MNGPTGRSAQCSGGSGAGSRAEVIASVQIGRLRMAKQQKGPVGCVGIDPEGRRPEGPNG